jgi:GNAT superfamily N-acetyltransferase
MAQRNSEPSPRVRGASAADLNAIVEFNRLLAFETEQKSLDEATLRSGVAEALADAPGRIRYWIAESGEPARPVGQAGVTREWSDWRNGWIWWLQSVYVDSAYRGQGVFRAIFEEIRRQAYARPDVIGVRLYVEESNRRAQQTYEALGLSPGGYHVFEQLWTDRFRRS